MEPIKAPATQETKDTMKKLPIPRTIESLRTIGHLQSTTQQNQRRHASEDRFTLLCMVVAVVASALVWICER